MVQRHVSQNSKVCLFLDIFRNKIDPLGQECTDLKEKLLRLTCSFEKIESSLDNANKLTEKQAKIIESLIEVLKHEHIDKNHHMDKLAQLNENIHHFYPNFNKYQHNTLIEERLARIEEFKINTKFYENHNEKIIVSV